MSSRLLYDHTSCGTTEDHGGLSRCSSSLSRPQQWPPLRSQLSKFRRWRRQKSANQPAHIPTMCGGPVECSECAELATAASTALDRVLPSRQLSNSSPATTAPPSAYAAMSALPSSSSRRCSSACAGISCTTQFFFNGPPRVLRGGLAVYNESESQIAGGGAAQRGPK